MKPETMQKAIQEFDYSPREKKIAHLLPLSEEFVAHFNKDA
jgi:hypothetical protein